MPVEKVDTLVVGAGQAGLAMSEHLSRAGVPHLVLERHRIAERWRSERWDSLVANGPAWHDRFPGHGVLRAIPEAFAPKETVADYFVAYAKKIAAPIRCGVEVTQVTRLDGPAGVPGRDLGGRDRGRAAWSRPPGRSSARSSRAIVPEDAGHPAAAFGRLSQSRAAAARARCWWSARAPRARRSPRSCCAAGRTVYLSVGPHDRPPRRLSRARLLSGGWACSASGTSRRRPPARSTSPSRSAARMAGRRSISGAWPREGMTLVGRTEAFADGAMRFAPDLAENLARGDANYLLGARRGRCLCGPQRPRPAGRAGGARDRARPGLRDRPDPGARSGGGRDRRRSSGPRASALDFGWLKVDAFDAGGRAQAPARRLGRARASISSGCPGSRGGGRASSGASGTTPHRRGPDRHPARLSRAALPPSAEPSRHVRRRRWRIPASASSTPATPIPSRSSTTTSARRW